MESSGVFGESHLPARLSVNLRSKLFSNLSNRFLKRLLATRISSHSTTLAVARCSKALMVMSFRLPSGVGISVSTEVAIA